MAPGTNKRKKFLTLKENKAILDGLLDGVLIVDFEGIILFANNACERLFGKKTSFLIGQNFGFPIEIGQTQEITITTSEFVHTLQLLSSKIKWGTEEVFLMSLRNVTEKKKLEEELINTYEELKQSFVQQTHANQELSRFNSIVSHDLKAPLRSIIGFSSLLTKNSDSELSANSKEYLEFIIKASKRMSQLVDDLLTLSTIQKSTADLSICDLGVMVREVLDELSPVIRENNAVVHVSRLASVPCIPGLLKQVFQNLLLNSLKFHKKGLVPIIHISDKRSEDGKTYTIILEDNGIGFDNKHASLMFEIFQRLDTEDQYTGTGIGLSIVKKIIEVHKGKISASSEPGKGAVFVIELPLNAE